MENKSKWYLLTQEKCTAEHSGTVTKNPDLVYKISLTIPNFRLLLQSETMRRETVNPCKYTVIQVPDTPFKVKMCFLGRYNNYMEIYYLSTISCIMKTNLIFTQGTFCKSYTTKTYLEVQESQWKLFKAFENIFLINEYDINDSLSLTFDFMVTQDNNKAIDNHSIPSTRLSNDFEILFVDGIYSDATIKSVEGEEFRVHKNVLAVRSKVLKAHFEHQTIESITNVVETTWETKVLRDLLTFVYTDKAPQVDDPDKLLAAADYYQLEGLKDQCEQALKKRLTVENAIETLQLAVLHSADSLREYTLTFINQGRAKLITETKSWANVTSVEILKMIFEFITAHEKDDYNILEAAAAELS